MPSAFFVSDLHGRVDRYEKLFRAVATERPHAVFLGGDLLPHGMARLSAGRGATDFVAEFLESGFGRLRAALGKRSPRVFLIPGNDDPRSEEAALVEAGRRGAWEYVHGARATWERFTVLGYAFVPPTPFLLKDWERYDVSRYVDPGCVPPDEGWRTTPADADEIKSATIREDLDRLSAGVDLGRAIFLLHTPPYRTALDRAALDGRSFDHAPLDVHVGSVALRRFVESRQPLLTLHGHVHESARLTGSWSDRIGRTHLFSAAHDGEELALIRFDPEHLDDASRALL